MDPQKKIWKGDPGHKYKLTNHQLTRGDSCTPFMFKHHCSLNLKASYPGTIIRLPLRNSPSEISSKRYTITKLKSLLSALKKDAEILLLFLRYVECIKVYTISLTGEVTKIFSVEADASTEKKIREAKNIFFNEVEEYHANSISSVSFPHLQYRVTVSVEDLETRSDCQWLVMNWVGSANTEILEMSNRMLNLPWLGLAVPLTLQKPSRLFCFLPMPDSDEVNPPLPVCVHGTFGLTKDRRHLKWKTSEMQNDDGALWNDLLLSKMLPSCYANCLSTLKSICRPDMVYSSWPNVNVVNKTNWKVLLNPLLSHLLHEKLFCASNGNWIKLQPSVYVPPEGKGGNFSDVVVSALIQCGKVVVELPNRIWEAIKLVRSNSVYPFTVISPHLVRQILKGSPSSYVNMSRDEKLELLQYCLDDDDGFNDLTDLILLPVTDKSFQTFKKCSYKQTIYIYDLDFLKPQLLAGHKDNLVNLEAENKVLHHKLQLIAKTNCTQLRILTLEAVALMLKNDELFKTGYCPKDSEAFFNDIWLKLFWKWVQNHSLSPFISIPLVPISNHMKNTKFKVVPLLCKDQSQVIKCSKNDIDDDKLITASEKLGCYISFTDDFKYFYHPELDDCIHGLSPSSFLSISVRLSVKNAIFTTKEAKAIRHFLFQRDMQLTKAQSNMVLTLRIFPAIQNNTLYSISGAKTTIQGETGAIMIAESIFPSNYKYYMPETPVILTCSAFILANLQSMLPAEVIWSFTKAQLTLFVMLPAIENDQLSRDDIISCTSIILEPKEYYDLIDSSEGDYIFSKLQSLNSLPTNERGPLLSPLKVYDPNDDVVVELFKGQEVYPVDPFVEKYFPILRELGMKSSDDLSSQDIVEVAGTISGQYGSNIKAETRRARKLLEFLSSAKGSKLLKTYYNKVSLEQTLCSMQWLPVMITPPKDYPKCLDWKGASGDKFVFPQDLHASSSLDDHENLPYLIGSQVKILHCDRKLSVKMLTSLRIPQSVPLNAMIQQYLELVSHKTDSKFEKCIKLLYEYLQSAAIDDPNCENWKRLSQSKVVQVRKDKFVKPSLVACSFDDNTITVGKLEPYLYTLPFDLHQYRSFFCHIGVKEEITGEDILLVLEKISYEPRSCDWELVKRILTWLCDRHTCTEMQELHDRVFVPVSSDNEDELILESANQVAFLNDDLKWLRKSKEALASITADYYLVHSSITYDMACKLQLKPLNTMIANTEEFCFEQAGQSEPLTTRLNRILREYKDTSVIQELLQNADDAGATEVAVYYDTREHDSSNLFFPGMANSYGPALLFYNNAEFTEEDFENIRKIAGQTKLNKPLKIGKFGIGFCSVYHITDVPSFVSGENLIIFDPTLQCLKNEIKSEFNPGIKINFHKHYLLNKSNQLVPYTGLSGFNPKKYFKGTLFRFPLRVEKSKISEALYKTKKVQLMLNRVKEDSSKLLMFLNNVKKITLWRCKDDNFIKDFEVKATKRAVPDTNDVITYKVTSSHLANHQKEIWLIATNSQQLQTSDDTGNHGTASVSVKLNTDEQSIEFITGECFCYLPLHIETGLPVHVSSNFAVMTNRRGLWKADNTSTATKESKWNEMLMESVVSQAYIKLLLHLRGMQQNGSLSNYTFHCLWPIKTREVNPWNALIRMFYSIILLNKYPLFYSKVTNSWESLNKCLFLSPEIFPSVNFQKKLYSSINQVISVYQEPLVNLTDEIWKVLSKYDDFTAQIIDEEGFVNCFYQDKVLEQVPNNDKSVIVAASLIAYANENYIKSLPELMRKTQCIPCCPDGKVFKQPLYVLDPKSRASELFLPSDHMWPDDQFLKLNGLLHKSLLDLGMKTLLPWDLVVDRAKHMQNMFKNDQTKSFEYLATLLECIRENVCNKEILCTDSLIFNKGVLKTTAFLPVMKKPINYPLPWKGNPNTLACGTKLTIAARYKTDSVNPIYACGSQVSILDTESDAIPFSLLTDKVVNLLGISKDLREIDVANHFKMLVEHFQTSCPIQKRFLSTINCIVKEVYKYWVNKINQGQTLKESIRCIKDKPCIWNESVSKFLHPSCVSFNWKLDGPFLYKLPVTIPSSLEPLMKDLGVKHNFPVQVLLNALCEMKYQYKDDVLPSDCQATVQLILQKLRNVSSTDIKKQIFLPDEEFILRNIENLRYNDAPWCIPDEKFIYCHGSIERSTAIRLGVIPVKIAMLNDIDITDEWIEEFGQEEKLTVRLNNILRDYPRDVTFLKEMLQNADDADATKLVVILDKRYHNKEKVVSEEWKQLQGPAILIWNNSTFSKTDLIGIQRIGLGSKRDDADKIGLYGIGFNVVYHFTDCPSFITNNELFIFDPHYRYIADDKRKRPGRTYKDLNKLWSRFPDMKSPYLQNDLDYIPGEMTTSGSLFRFPLRLTEDMAEQSEIIQNAINLQQLERDLKEWVSQVIEALLFLRNINDVKLYIIDDSTPRLRFRQRAPNPVKLHFHANSTKDQEKIIAAEGNAKLVMFFMTLSVNPLTSLHSEKKEKKWLVQLGEGNVKDPEFNWSSIKPIKGARPRHGIAAPMDCSDFQGKSFCFLPLPCETNLPVHIHGQFMLHSDRRGIWLNTSSDQGGSSNEIGDPRTIWNVTLCHAISAAYAHFLINCIEHKEVSSTKQSLLKSLQNYYNIFPNPSKCKTLPWSYVTNTVYHILSHLNAPILATLVLCSRSSSSSIGKFVIKWYKLHQPGTIDEPHFYSAKRDSLCDVLKSIGMNITDTPMMICEWFSNIDQEELPILPIVSRKSVIQYYIRFSLQIRNGRLLPCTLSSTKFCNIPHFITFLKYIMTHECKFSDDTEAFTDSVGLIITADEMLHSLCDGRLIISSNYWKLFPNSKQHFVHNDLQELYPPYSKYLMSIVTQNSLDQFNHISLVLTSNVPFKWNGEAQVVYTREHTKWIQNILKCIVDDPTFSVHCNKILERFPLLPADNGRVYSLASHVLPLKHALSDIDIINYDIADTRKLMTKLKVPLLQHDLLGDTLDKIQIHIPSMLVPENILKTLYLFKTYTFEILNTEEFNLLFEILKLVSYSNISNQQYIKQLPIFATIDNKLVSLSSASQVWIWDDTEVCLAGMNQWINHISSKIVFLNPSAPWAILIHEAHNLEMSTINKYDVYCKFIFPNFHHLNSSAQEEHLAFIMRSVFPYCKHVLKFSDNNIIMKVNNFVNALKSLRCIRDNTGTLRIIGYFYDHKEPIFKAFCSKSCFLPNNFRSQKWNEFFKYFGLKISPTIEEFISYCKQLPNFDIISAIKTGSEVLLNVLFDMSKSGVEKYQKLYSHQCLEEVSRIPIAIVEKMPDLDCIKEQKMGELKINSSLTLTRIYGSSLATNAYLVWTILPLINITNDHWASSEAFSERLRHLGVVQVPAVHDVLSNLRNLSTSVFASFDKFEKTVPSYTKSSLLPAIVVAMIKHLKEEFDYEEVCNQLEPQLSNLKFLPVKLPIQSAEEYALVKPTQVLCMEPSDVDPYYPFLHPLIDDASGYYKFLSNFGVKRSINFCHVQLVLQFAKDLCQDNEVDQNIKRVIHKITQELIKLLQQTENRSDAVCYLQPLYLLSQHNILMECSKLVVDDIPNSRQFPLPAGYGYLNLLKDFEKQDIKQLPYLLPKELQLKSLQSIVTYELIGSTPAEDVFPNVSVIKDILVSSEFKKAIEIFASCCNQGKTPESVTDILTNFQSRLTVQYLIKVQAKPMLKLDGKIIPLDDKISFSFFLHKSVNHQWILSLKNTQDHYSHAVFLKLSKQLCFELHLKSTNCFKITDSSGLPELNEFICQLLQCNSVFKISEVIKTYLPVDTIDLEMDSSVDRDPMLGDLIPEKYHPTLDQSLFNFFYPEEWVGYENENGNIVYAQILCEMVNRDDHSPQKSHPQHMMERMYIISVGLNERNIEVSALQLYKFIHIKSTERSSGITEVNIYDGPSTSERTECFKNIKIDSGKKKTKRKSIDKKAIQEAVKAALALPEEQQKKAIKRLYLQYHPDKNPDNPNATAEFQFLQHEIERMNEGIEISESTWHSCFRQWDRTASSHREYRSRYNSYGNGRPGGQNIPQSHPDLNEAKLWIGQAKYDYSALCVLKKASRTNSEVSAAACFMCHEVAEKSLKAGLYATRGMSEVSLKNHDLISSACALIQMNCPLNIEDAMFLGRFYLDTRFPNRYSPHAIPGEKFSSDTAKQGFEAAMRIYETVKQMIYEQNSF